MNATEALEFRAGLTPRSSGVSVVVCCHNSARRLPPTLAHLAAQNVPPGLSCELVIVDNASTDDTAAVALAQWPPTAPFPLRITSEPEPGLIHARRRGMAERGTEVVSFIDDDNWVCPNWVCLAAEIMADHPEVGACGGATEAVFEAPPPAWFTQYQGNFAVGPQFQTSGDVTEAGGMLWGAGLTVRAAAWDEVLRSGVPFFLSGRRGRSLTSGEDLEVCYRILLNGWRLWYNPRLRLQHYMPASRLDWSYFRRLYRAAAASEAWLDAYREELGRAAAGGRYASVRRLLLTLVRHPLKLALSRVFPMEGDRHVAIQELLVGRLNVLLRDGRRLDAQRAQIRSALRKRRPAVGRDARM